MTDLGRLTEMVAQRAAPLALYARQWLDAASAEDAVQEALTALLTETRAPVDPVAWIYRAVRNAAIDHARSASRRRRREQAVAGAKPQWFQSSADSLIASDMAEQALRRLPQEHREIVVLRIWGDLGLAQISRIVHLSVTTVHERYVWSLEQMRHALEKPCKKNTQ